jgi:integrase
MKQITSVGEHGATVAILQRGKKYSIRWKDRATGKYKMEATGVSVLTKAKEAAKAKADQLYAELLEAPKDGRATWFDVLKHFETHYLPLAPAGDQKAFDMLALDVWRAFLPTHQAVDTLEKHVLLKFIDQRQQGAIKVDGRNLRQCRTRAPAKDLEWLRRAVNLAISDGKRISHNPVTKVEFPKAPRPKRPAATWERFETVRPHCDQCGLQDLFGGYMDLAVGLGWRVSALISLRVKDIDRTPRPDAPNGRVLRREEFDKEGYETFVPISDWLAPRVNALLAKRNTLKVVSQWLFPKVAKPSEPWTRDYVKERLEVAERRAKLEPLAGGDTHPYRRMWANMRKHLPLKDVAYAGCWNERTLLEHYQASDDATVLDVMNAGLPS